MLTTQAFANNFDQKILFLLEEYKKISIIEDFKFWKDRAALAAEFLRCCWHAKFYFSQEFISLFLSKIHFQDLPKKYPSVNFLFNDCTGLYSSKFLLHRYQNSLH